MQKQADLQSSSQTGLDDGIAMIEQQLTDPNVPEDTKAELRKVKAELQGGKKELMQVFTGLSTEQLDQINDHSMKVLQID
jgi:hypothetical protein